MTKGDIIILEKGMWVYDKELFIEQVGSLRHRSITTLYNILELMKEIKHVAWNSNDNYFTYQFEKSNVIVFIDKNGRLTKMMNF